MLPIVFLPGTLCDERVWREQTAVFSPAFVVDLRAPATLEAMLEAVGRAPFERFAVAGFSMGGYVAQEFALRHPERMTKLVVVGAACEGYPPGEREVALQALPLIARGLFKGITERRLRDFLHPRAYADEALRKLIIDMAGPDAGEVYARQLGATLDRRDLSAEVAKIRCPMTVIAGRDDRIVPLASVLRYERYQPRAELRVLPDCGHFVPLEQPERVNEILAAVLAL